MWFVQVSHNETFELISFVLLPNHPLYNDLQHKYVTVWIKSNYPNYTIVHLIAAFRWKGEVKIG